MMLPDGTLKYCIRKLHWYYHLKTREGKLHMDTYNPKTAQENNRKRKISSNKCVRL